MVALNSSLVGKKFSVLATIPKDHFVYSSIWSSYVVAEYNSSRWHIVSYSKFIQKVLPPPYSDGGFTHMMHMKCIDLCINKQLQYLNKSLTSIFTAPSKLKFITFADRVQNDTFNTWLNNRFERCEDQCRKLKRNNFLAEVEFTVADITNGIVFKSSSNYHITSFYVRRSDYPVVVIVFKAQISFFEFLITLGSIISIWFGLSVRSIPQSLLRRSARSTDEIFHELRLKIELLGRFIKRI